MVSSVICCSSDSSEDEEDDPESDDELEVDDDEEDPEEPEVDGGLRICQLRASRVVARLFPLLDELCLRFLFLAKH